MIIGVSGKIGSGKDSFASILKQVRPDLKFEVKKFAGKLKQIATLLTGVPLEMWEDQQFKQQLMPKEWATSTDIGFIGDGILKGSPMGYFQPMTYRTFLQKLGTDAMRDGLHVNTWVNATFADYVNHDNPREEYPNWIITDVRFPNEADAVLKRGGLLIRINRPATEGVPVSNHPSETSLDDWTNWSHVISNNGTLNDLYEKVSRIAWEL